MFPGSAGTVMEMNERLLYLCNDLSMWAVGGSAHTLLAYGAPLMDPT